LDTTGALLQRSFAQTFKTAGVPFGFE